VISEFGVYAVYAIVVLLVVIVVYLHRILGSIDGVWETVGQVRNEVSCLQFDLKNRNAPELDEEP